MTPEVGVMGEGGSTDTASDLLRNRGIFTKFNRNRLQNMIHTYPDNYTLIFHIVPLLLHTNIKGFPGYVDHPETPCGVQYYVPHVDLAWHVDRYFSKKCKFKERENLNEGFVEFLSVMGSVGSIAQTKRSDFDIWVGIHRDTVEPEAYRRFLAKLKAVEEWLARLRLEVHFFPTDINSVSKNVFGSVDDESCGSAQALMLKDEFYRTSILIAGKIPFWWVVEPGVTDQVYTERYKHLGEAEAERGHEFIDIGNITNIDKGELFGAALWQLVKSLHSPFKSFMKMCLMEKYLLGDTDNQVSLLSNTLKKNVLLNESLDSRSIDGYLLLFDSIQDYFLKTDRVPEADMLRTCFYMKVQPNLTSLNKNAHADSAKRSLMDQYVKSWRWDAEKLKQLDTFYAWPIDRILEFDQRLKAYLIQSFQKLTRSRDLVGDNRLITPEDMTVITRKLMSHYMSKPKKVKRFYFSLDDTRGEPDLSIANQDGWRICRGEQKTGANKLQFTNLLYAGRHLSDLCLWTAFSGIYNPFFTKLSVFPGQSNVSQTDVSKLVGAISENLLGHDPSKSRYFLEEPFVLKVFVTCRVDNLDELDRISVFYLNSWKELFSEHFASAAAAGPLLSDILSGYIRLGMPNPVQFISFHSNAGAMKELLQFKGTIMDLLNAFKQSYKPGDKFSAAVNTLPGPEITFTAAAGKVTFA